MGRFRSFMNKLTCGLGHGIGNIFTRNQRHSYDDIHVHHCERDNSTNQSSIPLRRQHEAPFHSYELPFSTTSDDDMAQFFRDDIHNEDVRHITFMRSHSSVDNLRSHSPVSSFSGYSGFHSYSSGYSATCSSSSGYSGSHSSSSGYSGSRSSSSGYSGSHSSSSGYSGSRSSSSGYSGSHSSLSGYKMGQPASPVPLNSPNNQQCPSPVLSPSHPPLQERASIRDEILMAALSCLMHPQNCRIPNCSCKSLQDRYRELFQQNPSYLPHKPAAETCKRECQLNAYPRERKHKLHLTLSSQNFINETHPHYQLTNKSHIRVTKPPLQHQHSKECDLTPHYEIAPKFPQAAAADSPVDKKFRSDPTYEDCKPPLFLREISVSAENIPALCLNDCPLTPTPLWEGRTLASSPMRLKSRRWSMQKTTLKTVKEYSQSTDTLETNESNTSSRSTSLEKIGSVGDGELQPATAKHKHSSSSALLCHSKRGKLSSPCHHSNGSKQGSPVPPNLSQVPSHKPIGHERGKSTSPFSLKPTEYKKEAPVLPNLSLENSGGSSWYKCAKSASLVPSNLSGYSMGNPVSLNAPLVNPSGHKMGRSTSPVPLQPNRYMMKGASSPVPSNTIRYKREEPAHLQPSFMNASGSNGYKKERSASPVPLNSSNNQQYPSPILSPSHPPLQERASIRDEILMTLVSCLLHPQNCQIPNCPCKSLQDRYRELFHQIPSYVSHKPASPDSPNSFIKNPRYYNRYDCKRKQSASPIPSYLSGYKGGESGYESTTETIQSNPSTPTRRWFHESGYKSKGNLNPNSGSLARKTHGLKLQRQAEIDIVTPKTVTETLV